jgi:hypothetical protein
MADKKISALTGASTPLAGTEVLPIVQSGSTVKVAVSNLTAGRDVNATSFQVGTRLKMNSTWIADAASPTGNDTGLAIGANRIFPCDSAGTVSSNIVSLGSATYPFSTIYTGDNIVIGTSGKGIDFSATPGTGTSELLDDYEEGTWTPLLSDGTNNATMDTGSTLGTYTKVGNLVNLRARVITTSLGSVSGNLIIKGLPFTIANNGSNYGGGAAGAGQNFLIVAGQSVSLQTLVGGTTLSVQVWGDTGGSTSMTSTQWTSDGDLFFNINYYV